MEAIKKDIAELEKVNESMENKLDMSDMKKDEAEASESMEKSSDQLSSGNKSGASKSGKTRTLAVAPLKYTLWKGKPR